jgi:hypothetical protein
MAPAVNDDGAGGFFIIWQSSDTTPRLLAQYFDPNQKPIWDPQGTVVTGEGGQASIHASVFTPYNKLVVLWREPSPIGVSWSAQCLDASGQRLWDANGIPLVEEDSDRVTSSAAVSPAGKITAVWEDAGQEPHVVYAQRWLRAGLPVWGFNGTGVVETPGGEETNPLVVAGSQDAFVFWQDNRNLSKKLYAQRLKDDGTPVLRDGVDLAPLGSSAGRIYGVPDVSGGAVVMWVEPTVSGLWQLLAERLNASGSVAW